MRILLVIRAAIEQSGASWQLAGSGPDLAFLIARTMPKVDEQEAFRQHSSASRGQTGARSGHSGLRSPGTQVCPISVRARRVRNPVALVFARLRFLSLAVGLLAHSSLSALLKAAAGV